MQWFKHDTNSTMDFKIKKLIIKYGAIGYAIYFHCLELIASEISDNNITFELEHDSEIIADDLRISGTPEKSGKELVEEIMRFMITLNLFEENNGHIFCFKLLKRLDTSMTSSTKLRALITKAKNQEQFLGLQENRNSDEKQEYHDCIMIESGFNMQDKTRQDKTTKEKKTQENTIESVALTEEVTNKKPSTKNRNSKTILFDRVDEYTNNDELRDILKQYLQFKLSHSKNYGLEQWNIQLDLLKQYSNGDDECAIKKVKYAFSANYQSLVYPNELNKKNNQQYQQKKNLNPNLNNPANQL